MNDLSLAEYHALLRCDLRTFVERAFVELNPGAAFSPNWHIDLIASRLAAVARGEIRRLIVMVPPRHLKSICASVALPAWILGRDPSRQIICASYAQDLADKLARDTRALMTSPFYESLFPGSRLLRGKQSVAEFTTAANGYRLATSVGGVLTGRGADIIVLAGFFAATSSNWVQFGQAGVEPDDRDGGRMIALEPSSARLARFSSTFMAEQIRFGFAKGENLPKFCHACAFLRDCWGECPKNRFIRTPEGEPGLNCLCSGLRRFFKHAIPTCERIAQTIRVENGTPHV